LGKFNAENFILVTMAFTLILIPTFAFFEKFFKIFFGMPFCLKDWNSKRQCPVFSKLARCAPKSEKNRLCDPSILRGEKLAWLSFKIKKLGFY
jgi:hypothetical protein